MQRLPRRLKNAVVDVDGTLLDSRRDIAAAQHWVLQQLGVHEYQPEDIYPFIGKPLASIFESLLPARLHYRIPDAAAMYVEYYRPRALETTTLFPHVEATLTALRQRGIGLAIGTTKSTATTVRLMEHFGIASLFDQIQGSDTLPYKPDPAILLKILTDRIWLPEETIMVGDTDVDIEAGRSAGIATCAVTYGSLTREQLAAVKPDFLIDSFSDLLNLFPDSG